MSGGYFDYNQYCFDDIADGVEKLIRRNKGSGNYPDKIIERFKEAANTLRRAAIMAQRIDWLVSDDDGDESFMERWDEELKNL